MIWCYSASIAHWRTFRSPLTAVWEPTEVSMGANLRTRLPVCSKPRCSVRVSPSDNYSSNMELAIEALIRMKMSQLASYQSISGETRFKQDIKDGRTVSSLFPYHPHKLIVHVPLWKKHSWSNQIEGGVHKRVQNVNKMRGLGQEAIAHTSRDCIRALRSRRTRARTRAATAKHDALESPESSTGRKVDCFLPPPAVLPILCLWEHQLQQIIHSCRKALCYWELQQHLSLPIVVY